jgi:N-acetylglucosamine kinase-like BadF-type ATPase
VEAFLKAMNLRQPTDLIPAVQGGQWDRASLAALAAVVFQAAAAGDAVADEIIMSQARELALAVGTVARTLGMDTCPLALAGGVFLAQDDYGRRLVSQLRTQNLSPHPVTLVREPAEGAVRIAAALRTAPTHG